MCIKKERKNMELKGSKTEQNLMAAFAGESQARNKYTYFASVAKKEGFEQMSALYLFAFTIAFLILFVF